MFKIYRNFEVMDTDIPYGSKDSVLKYVVGSNQLLVFHDGALCIQSAPKIEDQYKF
jgi:hypothetical protein